MVCQIKAPYVSITLTTSTLLSSLHQQYSSKEWRSMPWGKWPTISSCSNSCISSSTWRSQALTNGSWRGWSRRRINFKKSFKSSVIRIHSIVKKSLTSMPLPMSSWSRWIDNLSLKLICSKAQASKTFITWLSFSSQIASSALTTVQTSTISNTGNQSHRRLT